jgi:hypothetical protein
MRDAAVPHAAAAASTVEVVPPERIPPADYELTDERVARWQLATATLEPLAASGEDASDAGAGDERAGDEVDRATRRLERNERAVRLIEQAGLTVSEYVLATVALRQAIAAADNPGDSLAHAVPPANLAYVLERRGALGMLGMREMESPAAVAEEDAADDSMERDDRRAERDMNAVMRRRANERWEREEREEREERAERWRRYDERRRAREARRRGREWR